MRTVFVIAAYCLAFSSPTHSLAAEEEIPKVPTPTIAPLPAPAPVSQSEPSGNIPKGHGFAIVGLAPIDDGTVHMLVLSLTSVGTPPIPTYCGSGWSLGFIKSAHKSRFHNNALIDMPGCWASSGDNPESAQIKFRYYSLDPAAPGVKEFSARAKRFERMMLSNNTGDVFFWPSGKH